MIRSIVGNAFRGPIVHWPPSAWQGSYRPPAAKDPRWAAFGLLACYLVLGVTVLGFSRKPPQILATVAFGMILDLILAGILKGRRVFPLSAGVSCLSLAILLNFSLGYHFLWLPVLITIASKYLLTFRGRHAFNPSMFGIVASLLIGQGWISLSPAYQWTGTAATAWAMSVFVVTAAVLLFALRIQRHWLIASFLGFYALQIALRAYVMRYHIPAATLVVGTLTSAPFFLFAFFMITDPGTSPAKPRQQVLIAFFLVILDLYYHTRASLFTFFFAGATLAAVRLAWAHGRAFLAAPRERLAEIPAWAGRAGVVALTAIPVAAAYLSGTGISGGELPAGLSFRKVPQENTGIGWAKSDILDRVDARAQNVGKWMLSVGDAVAVADVDGDGLQDIFLTQPLKTPEWRGKLFLNSGAFRFRKTFIPDLERYLSDPERNGLPSAALFLDYDNDGDEDLLVGFSYGNSHLFRNEGTRANAAPEFREVRIPFLDSNRTICLAANALDFDGDGNLDILMADAIPPYLMGYPTRVPFSIFRLPQPEYRGDRRMFHFMHDSWQRAENGGTKHLLLNDGGGGFREADRIALGMPETRWSLAIGVGDLNGDGFPDVYVANDFGRDDCYLNRGGKRFARQQGRFYEDLGLDTYKGMNASIGDVDGDLREDVYVSNVHHALQAEGSLLWLNRTRTGDTNLDMKESATGMGVLNPNRFGWGAAMADLDLDGRLDLVQANGMVSDDWDKRYPECPDYWYLNEKLARSPPAFHAYSDAWADIRGACIYGNETNRVYLNAGRDGFKDIAQAVGLRDTANTRGVAAADLDNDGDADLVITDQFGAPKVYENLLPGDRDWLGLDLRGGEGCNADAVGTKLWIAYGPEAARKRQYREVRLGNGFSAQGDRRIVFGMGMRGSGVNPEVTVQWCGRGPKRSFRGLRIGCYTSLTPAWEGASECRERGQ
jgi:enediyne biosynthesis protein E4